MTASGPGEVAVSLPHGIRSAATLLVTSVAT
jgi:hypothetical protein